MTRLAYSAARIVTCDEARATASDPLGVVEDGVVVIDDSQIAWIGSRADAPSGVAIEACGDVVITPGLVDAHTHAAWVGSRHAEYAVRMAGGDYRAIAEAGGGIVASHRSIRAASEDDVFETLRARLLRMAKLGATCIEVKSGYGLSPDDEMKQLRAIARARACADLPFVVATFLALHAFPESAEERTEATRAAFVRHVADHLVPEIAKSRLASFVDAYIDANAFRVDEARLVMHSARAHGLGIRAHVGQFADVGGVELAIEFGALSVDHLEHVSDEAIGLLAKSHAHAVLLPIASFTLNQAPPPVEKLRRAGIPLVVASDSNPGTAPSESLPLAIALGVRTYGLSPTEAIVASTRNAARSLDHRDALGAKGAVRGVLTKGAQADLVVWDLPHETAIVQPWGCPCTRVVLRDGRVIA
jgi:imidazolonepropionase